MARPVTLFTGQWADLKLEDLCKKAKDFGYDGLELACWGDHFEVDKALSDDTYCARKRDLLEKHDLKLFAISNHLVGQAVLDVIDSRHKAILPPHVWGDGNPAKVQERAIAEMKNTARAAQKLGVGVVNGFTGSSIWPYIYDFPPTPRETIEAGFQLLADRWNPILDVFDDCGVKFALEVHPTEIAFDIYSAEWALKVLDRREAFGFNFDPSHLIWQGVDPAEFIRYFPDRIYHVHMKDASTTLNGRTGINSSHLSFGDPRAVGISAASVAGPSVSRRSSALSMPSATTAHSRSSGKTAAWTANMAPVKPLSSARTSISRRLIAGLIPRLRSNSVWRSEISNLRFQILGQT